MSVKPKYDDETLYAAWVAHNRNGAEAAKALGMEPGAVRHHVRTKRFEQRYLEETAGGSHMAGRLAVLQTFGRLSEAYDRLFDIGMGRVSQPGVDRNGGPITVYPTFKEQVMALGSVIRSIPLETVGTILGQPLPRNERPNLTLVDARSIVSRSIPDVSLGETGQGEDRGLPPPSNPAEIDTVTGEWVEVSDDAERMARDLIQSRMG